MHSSYFNRADRSVQVVQTSESADNQVRVIEDFSDLDWENLDAFLSKMVPYSGVNSVARVSGSLISPGSRTLRFYPSVAPFRVTMLLSIPPR